tara:strand:- start:2509 stop:3084 length:576 start_codon:yes stop_codon:yes gene_type:complete
MTLNIYLNNKNKIMTPRLLLRPIIKNDARLIVEWRNQLAKEQYLIFFNKDENLTIEKHLAWFKNNRKNRADYMFIDRLENKPIGMLHFKNLNKLLGTAEAGKIIGDYSFRKKGFAKEAFGFWLKYGFEKLGLQKIYIYTDRTNTSNIGLNLKLGFKEVNNEYKQNHQGQEFLKMEILKSDIRKINEALGID